MTIEIEKWLKDRFRKAFEALKVIFEEADRQIHRDQVTGTLTRSSFRVCLGNYELQLSNDEQLENFLARCGVWLGCQISGLGVGIDSATPRTCFIGPKYPRKHQIRPIRTSHTLLNEMRFSGGIGWEPPRPKIAPANSA